MTEARRHDLRTRSAQGSDENAGEPARELKPDEGERPPARTPGPVPRRRRRPPISPRRSPSKEPEARKSPAPGTAPGTTSRTPSRRPRARRTPARPAEKKPETGSAPASGSPKVTNPIIGITCSFQWFPTQDKHECEYFYLYEPYVSAIHKAGGVPVIIPIGLESRYPSKISTLLDGLVLSGGGDVDPNRYKDLLSPKLKKVEPRKDRTEVDLFNLAFNRNIPILGICRGAQIMNVALDGTLYQDITSQVRMALNHDPPFPREEPSHAVTIEKDTKLLKALGESQIWVNSWHHQGLKLHGKGLTVSARASDGMIEGIEHPHKKWVVGVQWHPELMWENDRIQANLFKAFIDVCKG